ncbi:MAG: hypothetical protein F2660_00200 [Actinobacteria bacterium]|uniref:Unannotated protein n=1 Tax=freshwater metagenome TaxID=449393 RepID=A0A6J6MW48_9ZZZZ|nr:hypothetical protein [Actinomycetota bacterium]
MTNKVQNRLVEKFISEIEEFLQDLGPGLREDILREVRENLEARAEDESGELSLPNSLEYANDLRQAAGLDPVAPQKRVFKDFVAGIQERLDASPVAKAVRDFLRPFKPLFWVAIGISSYGFLELYILGDDGYLGVPSGLEQWLAWIALVSISVWLGSTNFGPLWRRVRVIATTIAILPMALMFYGLSENTIQLSDELVNGNPASRTTGLIYNGLPVTNIFPYDAEGNLLRDVRLVDDQGRPLNSSVERLVTPVVVELEDGNLVTSGYLRPSRSKDGVEVWNVYPLKAAANPVGFGLIDVDPAE